MNDRASQTRPKASGVRAFTLSLLGLFILAVIIFMQAQSERAAELSREKAAAENPVFILNEVVFDPEHPEIPGEQAFKLSEEKAVAKNPVFTLSEVVPGTERSEILLGAKAKKKKMGYSLGLEDVTDQGSVRASNIKIGIDYKVSKNASVGVAATRGIHDTKDAAAWGNSVDDETAAQANYKLLF